MASALNIPRPTLTPQAKLTKMEAEMKMVFQQKVQEKETKLKQSEEELYAKHREMKDALEKQRMELEEKKRRVEMGRPGTPEKGSVSGARPVEVQRCFSMADRTLGFGKKTAEKAVRSRHPMRGTRISHYGWSSCIALVITNIPPSFPHPAVTSRPRFLPRTTLV
jgi:septin 7